MKIYHAARPLVALASGHWWLWLQRVISYQASKDRVAIVVKSVAKNKNSKNTHDVYAEEEVNNIADAITQNMPGFQAVAPDKGEIKDPFVTPGRILLASADTITTIMHAEYGRELHHIILYDMATDTKTCVKIINSCLYRQEANLSYGSKPCHVWALIQNNTRKKPIFTHTHLLTNTHTHKQKQTEC
jgi:hypothetical protein